MSPLSLISVYEFLSYVILGGIFIVFAYWLMLLFGLDLTKEKFIIPFMSEWFQPLIFVALSLIFGHLLQGVCNFIEKPIIQGKKPLIKLKILKEFSFELPLLPFELIFGENWGGWPSTNLLEGKDGSEYPKGGYTSEFLKNWKKKAKEFSKLPDNTPVQTFFNLAYNLVANKELSKSALIFNSYILFYRAISICGLLSIILGIIILMGMLFNYITGLLSIKAIIYWHPPNSSIALAIILIIIGLFITRLSIFRWKRFGERWASEIINTFYNAVDDEGKIKS